MQSPSSITFQDGPYLDRYDPDFGDSSFDFSFADGDQFMPNGDGADTARSDSSGDNDNSEMAEKRSLPDDDDDEDTGKDPKRRESTDRAPKKPGRKPLTSEPTSVCLTVPH